VAHDCGLIFEDHSQTCRNLLPNCFQNGKSLFPSKLCKCIQRVSTTTPSLYVAHRNQFHIVIHSRSFAFMTTVANGAVRLSIGLRLIWLKHIHAFPKKIIHTDTLTWTAWRWPISPFLQKRVSDRHHMDFFKVPVVLFFRHLVLLESFRTFDNFKTLIHKRGNWFAVVSRIVAFPDGHFPGKTFPGNRFPDVFSRTRRFPERRFPNRHFPGKWFLDGKSDDSWSQFI